MLDDTNSSGLKSLETLFEMKNYKLNNIRLENVTRLIFGPAISRKLFLYISMKEKNQILLKYLATIKN